MSASFDFENIINLLSNDKLPPLHLWQPELSGDIDISIDSQGVWRHCGDEFKRLQIPKMFARILCREGDEYFLKTPVEKWRISVLDVPFYFIHLNKTMTPKGVQLTFVSNTEDVVVLDEEHPLRVEVDKETAEPSPYLMVRSEMEGKLSRNVYYELAEMAEIDDAQQKAFVYSTGKRFYIGDI
ncbi:MAG: hypothetical protein ACI9ES_002794 [Oceanospirillaceae bacterium]|jgi:hypothetical protein